MVPAHQSITLPDFQHAVLLIDIHRGLHAPSYARRKVLASAGDTCPLCSLPYDMSKPRGFSFPVVSTVVHTFLGGPLTVENMFVSCRRCQQSRQSSDLLAVGAVQDHLLAQRLSALQLSDNHLVALPRSADAARVRSALAARHAFPRSRLYAAQCDDGTCFIAISTRYGDGQSKGLAHLLGKLGGSPVLRDKRLTVYQLADDSFRKTVWQLIEANALVVGIARRRECRDAQDWWWLTSASVGELRKRKVGRLAAPFPVIVREVGESAIRMRRLAARRKLEAQIREAQNEWEDAEREYERYFDNLDNPRAFPVSAEMTVEILNRPWQAKERLEGLKAEWEVVRKRIE